MSGQVLGLGRACVRAATPGQRVDLGLQDSHSSGALRLAESATPSPSLSPSHPVGEVWNSLSVGPACHLGGLISVSARAPLELLIWTQIEGWYVTFEIFAVPDLKFMRCQKKFEDIGYLLAVLLFK